MYTDKTPTPREDEPVSSREILREVYEALSEKGYNPIGQIVGYLLSEDPTYITNCNNARALIRKIDRDELMQELVKSFLQLDE
ncbi:MAG: IreB family regulatory phosphoprotein [Clostridia bacterium]|nr:IreB family regulatory phosphoprotein [Clostridia bacterium]